jgi:hypothetical protein
VRDERGSLRTFQKSQDREPGPMLGSKPMSPKAAATAPARAIAEDDPVWRAALAAPMDLTPDTDEERAAIEEVKRTGFRTVPGAAVSAEIARRARAE